MRVLILRKLLDILQRMINDIKVEKEEAEDD